MWFALFFCPGDSFEDHDKQAVVYKQVVLTDSTSYECEACSVRLSNATSQLLCDVQEDKTASLKQASSSALLAFIPSGGAVCYYGNSVAVPGRPLMVVFW